MSKRKYVKKSDYWNKFNKDSVDDLNAFIENPLISPSTAGGALLYRILGGI